MGHIAVFALLVASSLCFCGGFGLQFPSTHESVKLFQLWSRQEQNATRAGLFDFVWSLYDGEELARYRKARDRAQPAVLSRYVPYGIAGADDPGVSGPANVNFANLSWWQEHHPSWILYQCDRKTPATYWGPGIGLDISNPDVIAWMLGSTPEYATENSLSVSNITARGFDAISLDVYSFGNWFKACGIWESPGVWKDKYTNATNDSEYRKDTLEWLQKFYEGIDSRLLLIPNHASHMGNPTPGFWGYDAWNSSAMYIVGNNTDGVLSEEGFSGFGVFGKFVTGDQWWNKIYFMQNLQRHGKAYMSVNYWGPNNTSTKKPEPLTDDVMNFIVASFALGKGNSSYLFLGPNQCAYGSGSESTCTCGIWCFKDVFELGVNPDIGAALGMMRETSPNGGVWMREFERGVAYVNPHDEGTGPPRNVSLDKSFVYTDLWGKEFTIATFELPDASGIVLLRRLKAPYMKDA